MDSFFALIGASPAWHSRRVYERVNPCFQDPLLPRRVRPDGYAMLVMHGSSYSLSCVEHRDQSIFQIRGLLQVVPHLAVFISSRNAPPKQTAMPN